MKEAQLKKYNLYLDIFTVANGKLQLNCQIEEAIQLVYAYVDLRRPYLKKRRNTRGKRKVMGL